MPDVKCVLIHDNFQNFKSITSPRRSWIADIPYKHRYRFYASLRPTGMWMATIKNGESSKARKAAFNTDFTVQHCRVFPLLQPPAEEEPASRREGCACMIVFCAFQQIPKVITEAEKVRLPKIYPAGVLQERQSAGLPKGQHEDRGATGRCIGAVSGQAPEVQQSQEDGKPHMIFNWFDWKRMAGNIRRSIPPRNRSVLKRLIETLTDEGDVVIDPAPAARLGGSSCCTGTGGATATDLKYPEIFTGKRMSRCSERRLPNGAQNRIRL